MTNINQETGVKSFCIAAYICRVVDDEPKYLIIKRASKSLNGIWQMVTGKIEKGENAIQATIREIKEETGLVPDNLYSTNLLQSFYDRDYDVINIVPVFLAFVDDDNVVLDMNEHSDYRWISSDEAEEYFIFDSHIEDLYKIEERFVNRKGSRFLEIPLERYLMDGEKNE